MRILSTHPVPSVALIIVMHCSWLAASHAQSDVPAAQNVSHANLELTDVVAYSTGLGFFSFTGEAKGDSVFRIAIAKSELDDLIKSLVVATPSGTATVHLPNDAQAPRHQSPRIVRAETIGGIIASLRGETISMTLGLGRIVAGRVLAVELRDTLEGDSFVEREIVSLLTDDGVVSVPLSDIAIWKADNKKVRERLSRELADLAARRIADSDSESLIEVEVRFHGEGKRRVMLGWLRSMPIWKPSYRFVDDKLQLWTTVENTTHADWNDVDLTLVDGHPIAFRSPLYRTRYANRRIVPLPLPDSRLAPEFGEAVASNDQNVMAIPGGTRMSSGGGFFGGGMGGGGFGGGGLGGGAIGGGGLMGRSDRRDQESAVVAPSSVFGNEMLRGGAGDRVTVQAMGADLHVTATAVTLQRGISRLAPSPELKIDAKILSVYVPSHDLQTPLRCLEIVNQMPMRLPAGPLTVYSAGTFVGDAMLPELSPNVPRMVGFGNDANIRVDVTKSPTQRPSIGSLSVDLITKEFVETVLIRRLVTYKIANRIDKARTLLIEHPKAPSEWTTEAEGLQAEESDACWRYRVALPASGHREVEVIESKQDVVRYTWSDVPIDQLVRWSNRADIDAKRQSVLSRVLDHRRKRDELEERLASTRIESKQARLEASRIAGLMKDTAPVDGGELQVRYTKKLSQLEDEIERYDRQASTDEKEIHAINRELE